MRLMSNLRIYACVMVAACMLSGCYSFRGISIPPDINTFNVENFGIASSAAPQAIEVLFTERLRDKVRNESRLTYTEDAPDIIFSGKISRYSIDAQSPEEGAITAFNKLTIDVQLNYDSMVNEDDSWTKRFSWFADFDASSDISAVEADLIDQIYEQIVEQIFNEAFTDW